MRVLSLLLLPIIAPLDLSRSDNHVSSLRHLWNLHAPQTTFDLTYFIRPYAMIIELCRENGFTGKTNTGTTQDANSFDPNRINSNEKHPTTRVGNFHCTRAAK